MAEVSDWFCNEFWPLYREFVKTPQPNQWGAGGRGAALKIAETKRYGAETRDRIMQALRAQISHRRKVYDVCGSMRAYDEYTAKNKSETVYHNRQGKQWLNQKGWEDEIPTLPERDPVVVEGSGELCHRCRKKETMGPRFSLCDDCYGLDGEAMETLREYYRREGLQGKTRQELMQLAKEFARRVGRPK